jgi:hypothetical protein
VDGDETKLSQFFNVICEFARQDCRRGGNVAITASRIRPKNSCALYKNLLPTTPAFFFRFFLSRSRDSVHVYIAGLLK